MHRCYIEDADFNKPTLTIGDRDEIHHIVNVLRLKTGGVLAIFNGQHEEASCKIMTIKEGGILVAVESVKKLNNQAKPLILACAVPKKAKFEFIIEKTTELGVNGIIPLATKRSDVVFSQDKILAKGKRFEKVAINAAKQSKRTDLPKIYPMTAFKEAFNLFPQDSQIIIAALNSQAKPIKDIQLSSNKPIVILIGPEGDFTPDEVAFAVSKGATVASLGSAVLKVDTAAMTSVAFCRFLLYN